MIRVILDDKEDFPIRLRKSPGHWIKDARQLVKTKGIIHTHTECAIQALQALHAAGEIEITFFYEGRQIEVDVNGEWIQPPPEWLENHYHLLFHWREYV